MENEVYGAIDIGSNAARLLIVEVYRVDSQVYYKKRSLVRVPLRLGEEVFAEGRIPPHKEEDLKKSMAAYKNLLEVNKAVSYKAVATSAMRDAQNGQAIANRIERETGIKIEIIKGMEEARLLFATHFEELLEVDRSYLYIDVGGGSTELSLFVNGEIQALKSFNIGTIRLAKGHIEPERWDSMKDWIKKETANTGQIEGIGSGGNINKLYKLTGSRIDKKISREEMAVIYSKLDGLSNIERITTLGMRGDRADVILPATQIFLRVMQWANCNEIYVPKFGLSDGIVRTLAEKK